MNAFGKAMIIPAAGFISILYEMNRRTPIETKIWHPESCRRGSMVALQTNVQKNVRTFPTKVFTRNLFPFAGRSYPRINTFGLIPPSPEELQFCGGEWLAKIAALPSVQCKAKCSIDESEMFEHTDDLQYFHKLASATLVCPDCNGLNRSGPEIAHVKFCHCDKAGRKIDEYGWTPFIEGPEMLAWKQENTDQPGSYIYKIYGSYPDISPNDFFQTQLDLDYRKKWDGDIAQLNIVEHDYSQNYDVIYWEMRLPGAGVLSNRDYCYGRRFLIDQKSGSMIIINRSIVHPVVPEIEGVVRVRQYWSIMHIKGVKDFNSPGVEFGLTYFDNSAEFLPSWMSDWVTMSGVPDFLNKIRDAARNKKKSGEPRH